MDSQCVLRFNESQTTYTISQLLLLMSQNTDRRQRFRELRDIVENIGPNERVTHEDVRKLKKIERITAELRKTCAERLAYGRFFYWREKLSLLATIVFFAVLYFQINQYDDTNTPLWVEVLVSGPIAVIGLIVLTLLAHLCRPTEKPYEPKAMVDSYEDMCISEFTRRQLGILKIYLEILEPARLEDELLEFRGNVFDSLIFFIIFIYTANRFWATFDLFSHVRPGPLNPNSVLFMFMAVWTFFAVPMSFANLHLDRPGVYRIRTETFEKIADTRSRDKCKSL